MREVYWVKLDHWGMNYPEIDMIFELNEKSKMINFIFEKVEIDKYEIKCLKIVHM